jgi:catechol 2,3-dioxygenase-like lactoylglutathione lyase family enzyme
MTHIQQLIGEKGGWIVDKVVHSVLLEVRDLKKTLYFYEGILGFKPSRQRPQLDLPGVWYDIGSMRICCIVNKRRQAANDEGMFPKIEVDIPLCEVENLLKKLDYYHVTYTEMEDYVEGKKVLSVYDPDQHMIQLQSQLKSENLV